MEDEFVDHARYEPMPTPPPQWLDVSSLLHLSLSAFESREGFSSLPLLHRFSNLQTLQFRHTSLDFSSPHATPSNPTTLLLPNLLNLTIGPFHGPVDPLSGRPSVRNQASTIFVLPKLEHLVLHVKTCYSNFLFPTQPHPPNTTHLRTLDLTYAEVDDEEHFLRQIEQLPALRELNLSNLLLTDSTLKRLSWPNEEEGTEGCCPLLQRLTLPWDHVGSSPQVLLDMVTSRRKGSERGGGCCRIEELDFGHSPSYLEKKDVELLRGQVGTLSVVHSGSFVDRYFL